MRYTQDMIDEQQKLLATAVSHTREKATLSVLNKSEKKRKHMVWDDEAIQKAVHKEIDLLATRKGKEFAQTINKILQINFDRKRIQRFLSENTTHTPEEYFQRVESYYEELSPYLHKLQIDKDAATWRELIQKFRSWAYRFLSRWELEPSIRKQYTIDCSNDAAAVLINGHFPYDVNFEPWACTVVHNICRKHMRQAQNPRLIPDYKKQDIDQLKEWFPALAANDHTNVEEQVRKQYDLFLAIRQLSPKRRDVILRHYFQGMTFAEIAEQDNVRVDIIHKRHFDALKQLRKIFFGKKD